MERQSKISTPNYMNYLPEEEKNTTAADFEPSALTHLHHNKKKAVLRSQEVGT
jgi:hypothetical protein